MAQEGSAAHPSADLPVHLSTFIGRSTELDDVAAAVERGWLTSVVGAAGLGKTRLVTEVARRLACTFEHGVRFCDLAVVDDPNQAVEAIGTSLRLRPSPGLPERDAIVDVLVGRDMLVVFDNCEHVLGSVAELVVAIGSTARTVRVLTTSRERLGVTGEWVVQLGPLSESSELFLERARAGGADVRTDDPSQVARICEKVDGLPLAVELLSAKRRTMTLDEIERALDDLAGLAAGTGMGGGARHRTLDASLAWSHRLLDARERGLFNQLSVFTGPFDVRTASAIIEPPGAPPGRLAHRLTALVEKSMVTADLSDTTSRFRLLEPMRQFARRQLEPGDWIRLRTRHLAHLQQRAMAAVDDVRSGDADGAYRWADENWSEIREATAWATATGDLAAGADLVQAGHEFGWWSSRSEVGRWAERLLAAGCDDLRVHGTAAFWVAITGDFAGQLDRVTPLLEANAWEITALTSWLWTNYASGVTRVHERTAAVTATLHSYEANKLASFGQQAHWAASLATLYAPTDPDQALERIDEALQLIAAGLVAPHWQATALGYAARACATLGRASEARDLNARAAQISARHDVAFGRVTSAATLAALARREMVEDPRRAFREALTTAIDAGDWYGAWPILSDIVRWWTATDSASAATTLRCHLDVWAGRGDVAAQTRAPFVPLERNELVAYVLAQLADPPTADGRTGSGTDVRQRPAIRRSRDRWVVYWDGHTATLSDLLGMDYLRQLVDGAGTEIPAATLAGGARIPRLSAQPLIDRRARAEIEARSLEVIAELARARRSDDGARVAKLEDEAEQLTVELGRTTALGTSSRVFSDADERARSAVSKAIRRALAELDRAHPAAADHLRGRVTTGLTCCYRDVAPRERVMLSPAT